MLNTYKVRVFNKIEDIGKDAIDSISDDPFFTYGWFKTLETSKVIKSNPLYLTVYDRNSLVAFLPCFLDLAYKYFVYRPYLPFMRRILNMGKTLSIYEDLVLMCYSPFCFRSKILLSDYSNRELITDLLSNKVDDICSKGKILFSSFEFVSENDRFLMPHLQEYGYLRFPWWTDTLYLDVDWSTFDEYLESLTYKGRKTVRRDIRKCRKSGVEIVEMPDFEKFSEKLSLLYSNLYKKYNPGAESPYAPVFFDVLSKNAKDRVKVFGAKKDGNLVGFSLLIRQKEVADAFMTGYDYNSQTSTDYTYFNLVFYEPIKWVIKERIKKVNYRISAEEAKVRRGCKKEKIFSFVKCHNKGINVFFTLYTMPKRKKLGGQPLTPH